MDRKVQSLQDDLSQEKILEEEKRQDDEKFLEAWEEFFLPTKINYRPHLSSSPQKEEE